MTHGILCCFFVQGIFISRVSAEGPAARAGVKVGDKLLEVNLGFTLFPPLLLLGSSVSKGQLHYISQVNGVNLHEAEHHTAVEALRSSGATVSMTVLREHMVEPENAITTTPLRPEDDYFPRERRSSGIAFNLEPTTSGPQQRLTTCLIRNDKGLGFSIAGGKGSTPYRTGDTVRQQRHFITSWKTNISGFIFSRLFFCSPSSNNSHYFVYVCVRLLTLSLIEQLFKKL